MLKKVIFVLLLTILISSEALAKSGLNLFAYPRAVPNTEIYDPLGKKVKLTDYKGEFVILVLWSKHCMPCIRELDNLNEFVNKTKDNGIKVLLLSSEKDWKSVDEQRQLLTKYGATDIDFFIDKDTKLIEDFGVFSYPHTVLINKNSEEIGRIRGAVEWDDEDVIEEIYKIKAQNS